MVDICVFHLMISVIVDIAADDDDGNGCYCFIDHGLIDRHRWATCNRDMFNHQWLSICKWGVVLMIYNLRKTKNRLLFAIECDFDFRVEGSLAMPKSLRFGEPGNDNSHSCFGKYFLVKRQRQHLLMMVSFPAQLLTTKVSKY